MRIDEIKGIAFPFRIDPKTGGIAKVSGKEKLKQNLIQLLYTNVGARFMERDYGCAIRRLVHEPNDEALINLTHYQIQSAITRWEPRIEIRSLEIKSKDAELYIFLEYAIQEEYDELEVRLQKP